MAQSESCLLRLTCLIPQLHFILGHQSLSHAAFSHRAKVSTLLVAQTFLSNFFEWDLDASATPYARSKASGANCTLLFSQAEVLALFQAQRVALLVWLEAHPKLASEAFEAVERVISFRGNRRRAPTDSVARDWVKLRDGVFIPQTEWEAVQAEAAATTQAAESAGYEGWFSRVCTQSSETMIDVEVGKFSIRTNKPELMPGEMGEFDDYATIFGVSDNQRPQCAVVRSSACRHHVRLLGLRHDLHLWVEELRPMADVLPLYQYNLPVSGRGDTAWVEEVLGPWRDIALSGFTLKMSSTSMDNSSALLRAEGTDPTTRNRILKQVVVQRSPPLVEVFELVSWGRCWYRCLVFVSDSTRSLHEPPASSATEQSSPSTGKLTLIRSMCSI